jgi:signal transduction histidine kinase
MSRSQLNAGKSQHQHTEDEIGNRARSRPDKARPVATFYAAPLQHSMNPDDVGSLANILPHAMHLMNTKDTLQTEEQLQSLSSRLLALQEEERGRLAKELHDSFGQNLVALKFGVENAIRAASKGNTESTIKTLQPLIPMVQKSIEEIRRIYMLLRPTVLDDFGINAAIEWISREFERLNTGIKIQIETKVVEKQIPESLKIIIYRVVQESLENVAKHSRACKVRVCLVVGENIIELTIGDDGQGFDTKEMLSTDNPYRGLGIVSMEERVKLSGGSFLIESSKDSGTTIQAVWRKA